MKMKPMLACMAILCICACRKEYNFLPEQKNTFANTGYVCYKIRKGQQYCDNSGLTPLSAIAVSFKVKFDSSAIYTSRKAENQLDINKLFGFSDNHADHHQFSARFGWRWSGGALRLFAYTYNAGIRSFKELGTVSIGQENICTIMVSGNEYIFILNGNRTPVPRASSTVKAEGYCLYPYFGGDEVAPHDISIWMKALDR